MICPNCRQNEVSRRFDNLLCYICGEKLHFANVTKSIKGHKIIAVSECYNTEHLLASGNTSSLSKPSFDLLTNYNVILECSQVIPYLLRLHTKENDNRSLEKKSHVWSKTTTLSDWYGIAESIKNNKEILVVDGDTEQFCIYFEDMSMLSIRTGFLPDEHWLVAPYYEPEWVKSHMHKEHLKEILDKDTFEKFFS